MEEACIPNLKCWKISISYLIDQYTAPKLQKMEARRFLSENHQKRLQVSFQDVLFHENLLSKESPLPHSYHGQLKWMNTEINYIYL